MAAPQPPLTDAAFKSALLNVLNRIAGALEKNALRESAPAMPAAPESPDYQRSLSEYTNFDWGSIQARVVAYDDDGPTQVEWNNAIWNRRAPQNKYGEDIWFSRYNGEDEAGNKKYLWLISFKHAADIDPLPKKVRQAAIEETAKAGPRVIEGRSQPKLAAPQSPALPAPAVQSLAAAAAEALQGTLTEITEPKLPSAETGKADGPKATGGEVKLSEDDLTAILDAKRPSVCSNLFFSNAPEGYNGKLLAEIVKKFKLDRAQVSEVWKRLKPNYTAALKEFDRLVR